MSETAASISAETKTEATPDVAVLMDTRAQLYGMLARLFREEMCIRDRYLRDRRFPR